MTQKTVAMLLLGATVLGGGAAIAAAQAPVTYDPAQLPKIAGTVAQYDLTPRGDVDGLILQDGTEVHFPPHLGLQVVATVRPGDAVTVHGLKARELNLVRAMSVTNDASGKTVTDAGPGAGDPGTGPGGRPPGPPPHGPDRRPDRGPDRGPRGAELQAQGVVKMALHGPRGEVNGALLENGTQIHLPPPEAERLADSLKPGQTIAVRGEGVANTLGTSIAARAIGPAPDKLAELTLPPPRGPHGPGHGPGREMGREGGPDAPPASPAPAQ